MSDTKPDLTAKLKHLDMLQAIISRMAQNSFLLKGWSVILATAILGIAVKDGQANLIWVALPAILAFWLLDGYFLYMERRFRQRFDQVRKKQKAEEIDFSMQPEGAPSKNWVDATLSRTLIIFHCTLGITVLICSYLLNR